MSKVPERSGRDHYLAEFQRLSSDPRMTQLPPWVAGLREQAIERFAEVGFPTTRQEDWRFTDVSELSRLALRPVQGAGKVTAAALEGMLGGTAPLRLVFVDGTFDAARSSRSALPEGVWAGSLAEALSRDGRVGTRHLGRHASVARSPFAALSTAFMRDGAFVHVSRGVAVEQPIYLLFVTTAASEGCVLYPRNLIVVESHAQATVVETYAALRPSRHLTNAVTEFVVEDGGRAQHYRVQREHQAAFHMATSQSWQGRDSMLVSSSIALGAMLSRHDIGGVLDGSGGHLALNGLSLLAARQHVDYHTTIDHAQPNCDSRELFNGIFRDNARGVFNGRIIVRPGAQRTDSKQTNNNVLLSKDARADSQPQLEIYADDVKCTHGATIGPLDPNALFYLRARGVPLADARHLLTYGFAADILSGVEVAEVREQLDRLVRTHIAT
jgi:Fe-S cluster assembly protein SufD